MSEISIADMSPDDSYFFETLSQTTEADIVRQGLRSYRLVIAGMLRDKSLYLSTSGGWDREVGHWDEYSGHYRPPADRVKDTPKPSTKEELILYVNTAVGKQYDQFKANHDTRQLEGTKYSYNRRDSALPNCSPKGLQNLGIVAAQSKNVTARFNAPLRRASDIGLSVNRYTKTNYTRGGAHYDSAVQSFMLPRLKANPVAYYKSESYSLSLSVIRSCAALGIAAAAKQIQSVEN